MDELALFGFPFNGDGTPPARENPAAALRQAGLTRSLRSRGIRVRDHGDLDIPPFEGRRDPETGVLNLWAWIEASKAAAERIRSIGSDGSFLLVLGGDCSILLGIFGAFARDRRDVGLVFLDGHTDYRTAAESDTGEPADLELAVLTGNSPWRLLDLFDKRPLVGEEGVVAFGFREPDRIADSRIRCFDRTAMGAIGITRSAAAGLDYLGRSRPLWLHFDVDVLDPTVMPVSFPEADGLSLREAEEFLSACLAHRRFLGLSVACYHPALDPAGIAGGRLVSLLTSVLTGSVAAGGA